MAAWVLKVIFLDNESFELGKFDSQKIAEDKKDEIFKKEYANDEIANKTVYYPASSILRAEILHYPQMKPDSDKT